MIDVHEGLNEAQRQAVDHVAGPLLVLAGPGSGKTRVITHRIARLVLEVGVPASQILAVTFTNKAADEMRRRLGALLGAERPWTSTFHSLAARLLRQYADKVGRTARFTIIDESDRARLLGRLLKEQAVDPTHFPPDAVARRISSAKNDLVEPEEFARSAGDFFDQTVAKIYATYQDRLRDEDAVDFDDLLLLLANLLRRDESVRARLDERFRFLLVDEYQDTNTAQYAIARALAVDHPNLCVTGDPDQSIYSWRGASLENILNFELDFPGARVIRLEQNYRSTKSILALADGLIRNNSRRKEKDLHTNNPAGAPVPVRCFRDERAEANHVADRIRSEVDQGRRRYRDFAVFVRTSNLSHALEAVFRQRHIPYQLVGGRSFFDRKEIKDVLAYARLVINPRDNSAFLRVVNTPPRGIGATSLDRLARHARQREIPLTAALGELDQVPGMRGKPREALRAFHELLVSLEPLATLGPDDAIESILERTEYVRLLENGDEDEQQSRLGHLQDMLSDARRFAADYPEAGLVDFLESISLAGDGDLLDDQANKATLMTLHAAKGLEFPVVFLVAFEHDILPHERSVRDGNEEEERRLAFVGITRAREELHLSYTQHRAYQGRVTYRAPSSFLLELPREYLDRRDVTPAAGAGAGAGDAAGTTTEPGEESQESGYDEPSIQVFSASSGPSPSDRYRGGMLVDHARFGRGIILDLDGAGKNRMATIQFPGVGVKRFRLSHVKLAAVTAASHADEPEFADL